VRGLSQVPGKGSEGERKAIGSRKGKEKDAKKKEGYTEKEKTITWKEARQSLMSSPTRRRGRAQIIEKEHKGVA